MGAVQNPLTQKFSLEDIFIFVSRSSMDSNKLSVFHVLEFRKRPEGYRKLTGRLACLLFVLQQFRKVPEAFRKAYRKLT